MSAGSPFRILRRAPAAGRIDEVLVAGGVWALELQDGAQPGLRLGLDRDAGVEESVPFDARGRRIPLDGLERFVLYWPDTIASTAPLVLEAWTVPARYEHRDGQVERQPAVHLLLDEDLALPGAGSITAGPFTNLPDDLLEVGAAARFPHGARLAAYFGFVGVGAFTADVQLQARALGSATFRQVKGVRGVGVPSTPTNIVHVELDVAAPPGEFQFVLSGSSAATVTSYAYLRLGA